MRTQNVLRYNWLIYFVNMILYENKFRIILQVDFAVLSLFYWLLNALN